MPRSAVARHALLLGDELVEQQQQRRRRVDRHRRRDLVERDAVEQDPHVRERVDRDAGAPDLAERARIVRVVAELRRQVEGDREPRLPAVEQVAVALVRLLGRREAGVLADRPRPAAVHVAVRAARERDTRRALERRRARRRPCRPASPRCRTPSRGGPSAARHAPIEAYGSRLGDAGHGRALFAGLRERAGWAQREIDASTRRRRLAGARPRRRARRPPLRRQQGVRDPRPRARRRRRGGADPARLGRRVPALRRADRRSSASSTRCATTRPGRSPPSSARRASTRAAAR